MLPTHLPIDKSLSGPVVIYHRVSARSQDKADYWENVRAVLRDIVVSQGATEVYEYFEVEHGYAKKGHRELLVAGLAQCRAKGCPLVAIAENRLLRPYKWRPYGDYDRVPSDAEWSVFAEWASGVEVYTVLPPGMSNREVDRQLTTLWMRIRRQAPVPPVYMRQGDSAVQESAYRYWLENTPPLAIAAMTGVGKSSVYRWVRRWKETPHGRGVSVTGAAVKVGEGEVVHSMKNSGLCPGQNILERLQNARNRLRDREKQGLVGACDV